MKLENAVRATTLKKFSTGINDIILAAKNCLYLFMYKACSLISLKLSLIFLTQDLVSNRVIYVKVRDLYLYLTESISSDQPLLEWQNLFNNSFVKDGSWDKNVRLIVPHYYNQHHKRAISYRSTFQLFKEKINYVDCDEYQSKIKGSNGFAKMTESELNERYEKLKSIYQSIKSDGYKSQKDLNAKPCHWKDEIKVVLDRKGKPIKLAQSANHRFAIAQILNIEYVPVYVLAIHEGWLLEICKQHNSEPLLAIKKHFDNINSVYEKK
ncbi:MAG: hypothetical protein KGZ85_04275 [Ignavibacterium sp.]|nr:hypothetical protein [Ignavibacterium sp.]